jgi:hypothetical protein
MAGDAGIELTVEQRQLADLAKRLSAEDGGKKLRLTLARNLRAAVEPAVQQVKGNAQAIHQSTSVSPKLREINPKGEEVLSSLGSAIAAGVGAQARLSGRATGVSVKARKKGMPRNFVNAPKRFNSRSFRRQVFGRRWVVQVGAPGWFDKPLHGDQGKYRAACVAAMEEMAARLAK